MAMPIPIDVKKCLVFLYIEHPQKGLIPNGTGFLVIIKVKNSPDRAFGYIVTAGHVLRQNNLGAPYARIFVRLNVTGGKVEYLVIPLVENPQNQTVFFHQEANVDIAAIPFFPDATKYDFKMIPEELIPNENEYQHLNISEGSEVFFTGLFVQHISDNANIPIVRFGRVALAVGEKVNWNGVMCELFLIELASYGGNSGSPVFFYLGADRKPGVLTVGSPLLKLAGVMMGAFQDAQPVQMIQTAPIPIATSNLGIAAVVPAHKIRELLFSPPLIAQRGNAH